MNHAKARAEVSGIINAQSYRLAVLVSSRNPDPAEVVEAAKQILDDSRLDLELLIDNIYEDGC